MSSYKFLWRKIDKNIESFLEVEAIKKSENLKPGQKIENSSTSQVLDEFPVKNLDDLKKIERKLKKDDNFHFKVVRYLIFCSKTLHISCFTYLITCRSMLCM